jgi:hypothetical protein
MERLLLLGCASLALIAATASAEARVTRIEITEQAPFAAGQAFGNVGAYEKVVGRFRGARRRWRKARPARGVAVPAVSMNADEATSG